MSSWKMDPQTKDYVLQNGAPERTSSLTMPAYFRLMVRQGSWLYAPNPLYGSKFHLIRKHSSAGNSTQVEQAAADALQPIVDDGRAAEITVETDRKSRHGVGLQVDIEDSSGNQERLNIVPIGR